MQHLELTEAIERGKSAYLNRGVRESMFHYLRAIGYDHETSLVASNKLWHWSTYRRIHRRWGLKI